MVLKGILSKALIIQLLMRNNLIMKRAYFIAALVVVLVGCQPKENTEQLKAINKSLEYSNDIIKEACKRSVLELEDKYNIVSGNGSAAIWLPIMNVIKTESDNLTVLIENIKGNISMQTDDLKIENVAVLDELYGSAGSGYNLLSKLAAFKDKIPATFNIDYHIGNPVYYAQLKRDIVLLRNNAPLLPDYVEGLNEKQRIAYINKWLDKNLRGSSALMAMTVLNKLENDILNTRTILMDYCNMQVGAVDGRGFASMFSAILSLSSSYVKRGEAIEVTAGIGEISIASKPRISIDGKKIQLDHRGLAIYKFNATGRPGKYRVPVKFEYIAENGKPMTRNEMAEYTIAEDK